MPNRCVAICPNIASNEGKRETISIQHCCELPDSGYSVTVKSTPYLEKPMLQPYRFTGISCLLGDVAELNRNLEALGLAGILHPKPDE